MNPVLRPGRVTFLHAVAVAAVLHHLACADALLVVYLPEDGEVVLLSILLDGGMPHKVFVERLPDAVALHAIPRQ